MRTPPEMTCGFLTQLVFCKKKTMWFIGVEVEQETSAPPPKKNPGSAPALHNLRIPRAVALLKHCTAYYSTLKKTKYLLREKPIRFLILDVTCFLATSKKIEWGKSILRHRHTLKLCTVYSSGGLLCGIII